MRIVLVGSSPLAMLTTRRLLERKHEVVIVEKDAERIETLSEELDCGLIHGDGSRPAVLRELDPEGTDFLFCLTGADQDNIIAGLVGRSLGFGRVIVQVEDPDFEPICKALGLEDAIVPDREVANALADIVEGHESPDLSGLLQGGLRFFSFVVREDEAGAKLDALELPRECRVVAVLRADEARLPEPDLALERNDQVVLIIPEDDLDALRKRFGKDPNGSTARQRAGGSEE